MVMVTLKHSESRPSLRPLAPVLVSLLVVWVAVGVLILGQLI
jgi:hypothetical protein